MSDGLKTGLIVAAAGVAGYLLLSRTGAVASMLPPGGAAAVGGSGSPLAPAPGVAPAATVTPPSSPTSGRSTISTVGHFVAVAAIAPIVLPTKLAISGAKAVGSAVESTFKSIGSIF
jgi:hypothetical protein